VPVRVPDVVLPGLNDKQQRILEETLHRLQKLRSRCSIDHPVIAAHCHAHSLAHHHLPILDNLLPARFAVYVALFTALLFGLFIDQLPAGRRGTRVLLVSGMLVAAAFVPPLPFPTRAVVTPAYFTASPSPIPPGSALLVVPFSHDFYSTQAMLWQAQAGMSFSMPEGYIINREPSGVAGQGPPASVTSSTLQTVASGAATNAPAGLASGTGLANNATVSVGTAAGAATGTGSAFATAFQDAPAGLATGTGAANNATVTTGSATNAPAGNASGTGAAGSPTANVKPGGGLAAGTGATFSGTSSALAVDAGNAAGTGAAQNTGKASAVNAGAATGTGAANPTAFQDAPAGLASGSGLANNPTIQTGSNTNAASGAATGAGSAYNPTITTATFVNAGLASGAGAALAATTVIAVGPGFATGTGLAYVAEIAGAPAGGPGPQGTASHHEPGGSASNLVPVGAASNPTPKR